MYNYLIKYDKLKCIFGEAPKTACTSMKMALSKANSPGMFFSHMRRNMGHKRLNKIMPSTIVADPDLHPDYFKFVFVRNPFDRLVSAYKWGMHGWVDSSKESFHDFIISLQPGGSRELKGISSHKANHVVPWTWLFDPNYFDYIGRFEYIYTDWHIISKKLNLKVKKLPFSNKTKHDHYSNYYNEDNIEWVFKFYKDEIKLFDYTFEQYY